MKTNFKFRDDAGVQHEGTVEATDYAAAADVGLSLSQFMSRKFPTDEAKYGTVLSQALASNGLHIKPNRKLGIQSSSMKDVFKGLSVNAGGIVAPDGTGNTTPAGRIFFPEVILQTIAASLEEDKGDYFQGYENLLSGTETVNAPEFKRAKIDLTAPEGSEAQSVAQLAEPAAMVSITAADSTTPIPSKGIGVMISDQAIASTSFDLVNTVMARQAKGEKLRMVNNSLADCFNGNADIGLGNLNAVTFQADTVDTAITALGEITQKAWVHFLRDNYQTMTITNIVCTIDTALKIEARTGKPVVVGDDPTSPRIDSLFSIENLGIRPPRVFLVPASVVAENRIVGLDNEYALRRYINVSASYSAIEEFLLRRARALRVDFGETTTRVYDDAFSIMDLVV
jgi:hypothetical protein